MIIFAADLFAEQYKGGAELTTEAIFQSSLLPMHKALTSTLNVPIMQEHKNAFWIFGNFANLSEDCLMYAIKNLKYSVLEYDYKYCKYRSSSKHINIEGECYCHDSRHGKIVAMFLHASVYNWWMSKNQRNKYKSLFSFLKEGNEVLSSVFSDETLDYIESLDTKNKNNKWVIMNSQSWIKGVDDAVKYAKENDLEYELLWGLEHKDFLKKLAKSRGLIFLPKGRDTCPRMVIEAKLLDCELVLNEGVQHKNEEWFQTKQSTMQYLRNRTQTYWDTMEDVAAEHIGLPKKHKQSQIRYHIVVPFYNAGKWIEKNILSIKKQRHLGFICTLIDDISTDNSAKLAEEAIKGDDRFELIKSKEKRYALGNIAHALNQDKCDPEDVVILLDGDDWFASSKSLSRLSLAYEDGKCVLTYGSYIYHPMGVRGVEPSEYPPEVVKNNAYRQDKWRASHLRTFKHKLWELLSHKDLKDDGGEYYKMTYDQAIMLPLLEMAAERAKYIPELLHVYNKENPLNVDKIKAQQQYALAQTIREKQKYERLQKI